MVFQFFIPSRSGSCRRADKSTRIRVPSTFQFNFEGQLLSKFELKNLIKEEASGVPKAPSMLSAVL